VCASHTLTIIPKELPIVTSSQAFHFLSHYVSPLPPSRTQRAVKHLDPVIHRYIFNRFVKFSAYVCKSAEPGAVRSPTFVSTPLARAPNAFSSRRLIGTSTSLADRPVTGSERVHYISACDVSRRYAEAETIWIGLGFDKAKWA
jgi:hypothetical protein